MSNNSSDNKRIAVNTVMLYFRMFLTMGVSLFTSRVILQSLGVDDYGIYNVVAGFVSMFTFINSAMTSATQRYITFAIGRGEFERVNTVFCTCLNIHILISLLLVIVAESFGLWFLNTQMTIPSDRLFASNVVFQMAILSTVVMMLSVPYNALIVAHEKMSAFAYISIAEVSFKLLIAYALFISPVDRLILYAILMFAVQFLIQQIYRFYCRRKFKESKFRIKWDKPLFKEMVSFSVWSLFGNLATVFSGQGVNVLLNMFFGPAINAARGLALQVQSAITGFSANFQMAMNPQITKNYANAQLEKMHTLIYASSRFSYYLLFVLSLPIIMEADTILSVWLSEVPPHTANFLRITLFSTMISATAGPLTIAAQANGNIKTYQATVGGIMLLTLPLSYCLLKIMDIPEIVYWVDLCIIILAQIVRAIFMRSMIKLDMFAYTKQVVAPILLVTVASSIFPLITYIYLPKDSLLSFVAICSVSVISVLLSVYIWGIQKQERAVLLGFVKKRILR